MSEANPTQAVVDETKTPAQPGVAENNARVDADENLDTLLKDFDEQVAPRKPAQTQPEPKTDPTPANNAVADPAIAQLQQRAFREDMNKVIDAVRGDIKDPIADNDFVESWIDAQARKDPRLQRAWLDRHSNPAQFERITKQLGKDFAKKLERKIDPAATEDRDAVTAAVRGASTRAPEGKSPDYGRMTDGDFLKEKSKLFGT